MSGGRQRGFTLLEVLVASAILGVAVVSLLGLHARNLALVSEAEELTVAGTLAGDLVAATRLEPLVEEGSARGRFVARREDADGRSTIYGGPRAEAYTWQRDVLPTSLPTLKQLRVAVFVTGRDQPVAELWAAMSTRPPAVGSLGTGRPGGGARP